jgi:hypothetical protein
VPATAIAKRVADTRCSYEPNNRSGFTGVNGKEIKGVYVCSIDFGCGQVKPVPVWVDATDALWFGPDSAASLTAHYCLDSISDPDRRRLLAPSVQQGG